MSEKRMNIDGVTDWSIIDQYQEQYGAIVGIDMLEIEVEEGMITMDTEAKRSVHAFIAHTQRNM